MISIQQLCPLPLKEGGFTDHSQIWLQEKQFKKGNRYLVTAPSGKGKSTFLHILYGLRRDYEGTVSWAESDIHNFGPEQWSALRQEKLSIVFQDLRLFMQQSAWENIWIKNELTQQFDEPTIHSMAERLGVEHLLNKPAHTLSYGQRQRFAIIRALCQPFDFLLLDEPFSHLDNQNIEIASQLIEEHRSRQEASLILVSLGEPYLFTYEEKWQL